MVHWSRIHLHSEGFSLSLTLAPIDFNVIRNLQKFVLSIKFVLVHVQNGIKSFRSCMLWIVILTQN